MPPPQAPVVAVPAPEQPTVMRSDLPPPAGARQGWAATSPAGHIGSDGYPNINVDTASPAATPMRSAEERDRLEAELLALGERQRSGTGGRPQSVVEELKELGRRSKAEALRQIESGDAPTEP
ncbi:MAG: hypothetical protein OEL76_02290 [Siculibacillus sp.]|nr:hypothetical protein [Siculibacillus sp.]